jgi:hypothetical protein
MLEIALCSLKVRIAMCLNWSIVTRARQVDEATLDASLARSMTLLIDAGMFDPGLPTQGAPGVPQDPFTPPRGPLEPSPDRESGIGNAPALAPGPLARLQDLQLLTALSPQARVMMTSR